MASLANKGMLLVPRFKRCVSVPDVVILSILWCSPCGNYVVYEGADLGVFVWECYHLAQNKKLWRWQKENEQQAFFWKVGEWLVTIPNNNDHHSGIYIKLRNNQVGVMDVHTGGSVHYI